MNSEKEIDDEIADLQDQLSHLLVLRDEYSIERYKTCYMNLTLARTSERPNKKLFEKYVLPLLKQQWDQLPVYKPKHVLFVIKELTDLNIEMTRWLLEKILCEVYIQLKPKIKVLKHFEEFKRICKRPTFDQFIDLYEKHGKKIIELAIMQF